MKDVKDGWLDVWVGWVDKIKKAIQEEEPNSCIKSGMKVLCTETVRKLKYIVGVIYHY